MGVLSKIKDYFTAKVRRLNEREIALARGVFRGSINYRKVFIARDTGGSDRAWVEPAMGLHVMHLGAGYVSTDGMEGTLIHELTHVWQGQNHLVNSYFLNAAFWQAVELLGGPDPYAYARELGKAWDAFNAEQQAQIVEDWYLGGMSQSDPRFRYIRDNIRRPLRSWFEEIVT